MVMAEFSVVPLGKGESVSESRAHGIKLVDEGGREYLFTPMASIVGGDM